MMKKTIAFLLLCSALLCLCGCSAAPESGKITVVAAIFPEYDWARQIIGQDSAIDLQLLVDDGVDPHSFQPAVSDLVAVADCDLLIFGGGESDAWLKDALSEGKNDRQVLELISLLGDRAHSEEIIEGMQAEDEDDAAMDEHVWLSLDNAAICCRAIADALCRIDSVHADTYRKNLSSYLEKLTALDNRYRSAVETASGDTILVCDRFPYRYLTEDYGIRYFAAFPGCSAESEASFDTVIFLAEQLKNLGLNTILITETGDGRMARSVAETAGLENAAILVLDSMQSVSLKEAAERTYLDTMAQNLQVLTAALN